MSKIKKQLENGINCYVMLGQGYALKTLGSVKDASHKRPHTVRFHGCEMSRLAKSTERKELPGPVGGGRDPE